MQKKLIKHGNSHALVMDKAILEILQIDPETTQLELTTDGDIIVITPIRDTKKQKNLQASLAKIDAKYSKTFKNLAKK
jgi:antitoxin component of MazEF toxin-antitoxin module